MGSLVLMVMRFYGKHWEGESITRISWKYMVLTGIKIGLGIWKAGIIIKGILVLLFVGAHLKSLLQSFILQSKVFFIILVIMTQGQLVSNGGEVKDGENARKRLKISGASFR